MLELDKRAKTLGMKPSMLSREVILDLGGKRMLDKYKTLQALLGTFFPGTSTSKLPIGKQPRKSQAYLTSLLKASLPDPTIEIYTDYRHPDMFFRGSQRIFLLLNNDNTIRFYGAGYIYPFFILGS
jgi:hypothetical protein